MTAPALMAEHGPPDELAGSPPRGRELLGVPFVRGAQRHYELYAERIHARFRNRVISRASSRCPDSVEIRPEDVEEAYTDFAALDPKGTKERQARNFRMSVGAMLAGAGLSAALTLLAAAEWQTLWTVGLAALFVASVVWFLYETLRAE